MAMEINNVYGSYANNYAQSTNRMEKKSSKIETTKTNDANSTETVNQSSKDYLNNLRQKYSDVNITVVDFKSEKQELNYMLGCSGGNNLAMSQSVIDKMAKDPAVAAKYEKVIADIPNAAKDVKERVESTPGSKLIASGVKIDKDGKVTYWSVSSRTGEGPGTKEKMQKMLEEKRVEKRKQQKLEAAKQEKLKEQERLEEKRAEKRADDKERMELMLAKGSSVEELSTNIQAGNSVAVNSISEITMGSRFDVSI